MDALIRQANKRVQLEVANTPETRTHGEKEEEKRGKKRHHFLKRKRRQDMSASNRTKAGYT